MNIINLVAEVATAQIVDGIVDPPLILDEVASRVDEAEDDEVEEVGKNIRFI